MPPEAVVNTPYGQMVMGEDGKRQLVFTPEGKQLWAQEQQRIRQKMGPNPVRHDPNAPQMDITPGKPAFDPFGLGWMS